MRNAHPQNKGFMSEHDIEKQFTINRPKAFPPIGLEDWYKAHTHHPKTLDHMDKIGSLDCDLLVDKWFEWLLTMPSRANPTGLLPMGYASNVSDADYLHLFKSGNESVYFAAPPFNGETVRAIMTEKHPVLFPAYWVETSQTENPSLNTDSKRNALIKKDLEGLLEVSVTIDGEPVFGCTVVRTEPLPIQNVPGNNILGIPSDRVVRDNYTINLHHGGLWILFKADNFDSGDHKIAFKSTAVNYEMEGRYWISALV